MRHSEALQRKDKGPCKKKSVSPNRKAGSGYILPYCSESLRILDTCSSFSSTGRPRPRPTATLQQATCTKGVGVFGCLSRGLWQSRPCTSEGMTKRMIRSLQSRGAFGVWPADPCSEACKPAGHETFPGCTSDHPEALRQLFVRRALCPTHQGRKLWGR